MFIQITQSLQDDDIRSLFRLICGQWNVHMVYEYTKFQIIQHRWTSFYVTLFVLQTQIILNSFTFQTENYTTRIQTMCDYVSTVLYLFLRLVHTECSSNKGGCSHLCLLSTEQDGYSCQCPDNLQLERDGRTCSNRSK